MIKNKLYKLETNIDFGLKDINLDIISKKIYQSYKFHELINIKQFSKKNLFSKIYLLKFKNKKKIVFRSCNKEKRKELENQCKALNDLSNSETIKFLLNNDSNLVTDFKDESWIAYEYIEGHVYDGELNNFDFVFDQCVNFSKKLSFYGEGLADEEKRYFRQIKFDTFLWKNSIDFILNSNDKKIFNYLSKDLIKILTDNFDILKKIIIELCRKDFGKNDLVHYDLQHANLLISKFKVKIIDIEDICYAPINISLSYCAFKLARHIVYKNNENINQVKIKIIPKILEKLSYCGIKSKNDLFSFAMIRTLNDISMIIDLYKNKKFEFILYDLEKKLLNLFEIADIFENLDKYGIR